MKITEVETIITRPPIRHPGKLGVGALEAVENVKAISTQKIGGAIEGALLAELEHALRIAASICIYTNDNISVEMVEG